MEADDKSKGVFDEPWQQPPKWLIRSENEWKCITSQHIYTLVNLTNIAGWKMDAPDWVDGDFLLKMGIFQPAMLVYQRAQVSNSKFLPSTAVSGCLCPTSFDQTLYPMENLLLVVKMNYLWKTKHHGFKFRLFIFGVVFTTCLSLQQGVLGRDVCFRWIPCPPYQTSSTNRLIYAIFFHVLQRNIHWNDLFFTATPKIS